jgi:hypothetical protein
MKCKTSHGKNVNLGVLGVSPYDSNVLPQSCLDPRVCMCTSKQKTKISSL